MFPCFHCSLEIPIEMNASHPMNDDNIGISIQLLQWMLYLWNTLHLCDDNVLQHCKCSCIRNLHTWHAYVRMKMITLMQHIFDPHFSLCINLSQILFVVSLSFTIVSCKWIGMQIQPISIETSIIPFCSILPIFNASIKHPHPISNIQIRIY